MNANEPDPRFSKVLPSLQLKVNSSSLGPAKACARQYEYSIIRGMRKENNDLAFGTLVHSGIERYDRERFAGVGHEDAIEATVLWALQETWDKRLKRPKEFLDEIGRADNAKSRLGLIRTLVWYLDQYGENDLAVLILNGSPAIELNFEFDAGLESSATGEKFSFIGRLDKIVLLGKDAYIKDVKTTRGNLGSRYFTRYTPDNQFSLYSLAGRIAFGVEVKGLIADAIQVGVGFSRFERAMVPRATENLEEWLRDAHYWLGQIDRWAEDGYWPMNDRSCGLYGGCPFREICGMRPAARETWIRREWPSAAKPQDGAAP